MTELTPIISPGSRHRARTGRRRLRWLGIGAGLLALGALPPGPATAQGPAARPAAAGSPRIVDRTGRPIGYLAGGGGLLAFHLQVLLDAGGALRAVRLGREAFVGSTGTIGFESEGCLGPPFLIPGTSGQPFVGESAIGPGNVLLGPTGDLTPRTLRSVWNPNLVPACTAESPTPISAFAVVELLDLDVFEPPFRVE